MVIKPERSATVDAADEVRRDIGEWQTFRQLLFDDAASPIVLEARFDRENPAPMPQGLLGWATGGDDSTGLLDNRPAKIHERRRGFVHRELAAHLAVCHAHPRYLWLAGLPGFAAAERSITAGKGDATARGLTFLRIVSGALVQWAVMRYGTTTYRTADGAALKLHLTRDDMREAAALADQLRQVLSGAFASGSETAQGAYRHSHDLAARGKSRSFRELLAAVSVELRERADGAERVSPNNDTAADRALAVDLARGFAEAFKTPYPAIARRLCGAFGVTLTRTAIDEAIAKRLELPG